MPNFLVTLPAASLTNFLLAESSNSMREAVVPQKTFKMWDSLYPTFLQGLGQTQTTASVRGQIPELPGGSTFDLLGETHSL